MAALLVSWLLLLLAKQISSTKEELGASANGCRKAEGDVPSSWVHLNCPDLGLWVLKRFGKSRNKDPTTVFVEQPSRANSSSFSSLLLHFTQGGQKHMQVLTQSLLENIRVAGQFPYFLLLLL